VATNTTLDTASADHQWKDHGIVVQSVPNRDLWNAIDPNIAFDDQGNAWMVFGSFWQGMKLVRLDSTLLRIKQPEEWQTLSRRSRSFDLPDADPGDAAVEAPFIFRKNGYYYLFVSFDHCCRGVRSDYKIMVGRSKSITGPYLDKEGVDMFLGGGSVVLQGDDRYPGLGHNSVYTFEDKDFIVCHAYDAEDEGRPVLRIMQLSWDEDLWPVPELKTELECSTSYKPKFN
jgi:arabinan endo-1,5-alpha-L-arabinosidase